MKVFHGTRVHAARIQALRPSDRGSLGAGIYFANSPESAEAYGDTVLACTVTLKNPWVVGLDYETELAYSLEFDSPGLEAIMALAGGRALIEEAKASDDGMFDGKLTELLKGLGHDGIVGTYPDGSQEVVAFEPRQVNLGRQLKEAA